THGFVKSSFLPDGDLFLLQQVLTLTVVSPSLAGVEIFNVTSAHFGGSPVERGGFAGTSLQGLSLTGPGTSVDAVSCTDRFRKVDFEIAGTNRAAGERVRLPLQDSDGNGVQELARFTVENGGLRVTSLNANVT